MNIALKKPLKRLKYLLEAIALVFLILFLYPLKIDYASNLMGFIFRKVGPYLKASGVARENLSLCFPDMSKQKQSILISQMWDNIGRIVGELTHWHRMTEKDFNQRVKLIDHSNGEFFEKKASLVLSGHYGNWEIYPQFFLRNQIRHSMVYRHANNPFVDYMIKYIRRQSGGTFIAKGINGMRDIISSIKDQKHVGMLVDQKINTGIMVPFFGKAAPTTPSPATLALKFGCPIFMTRIVRKNGAKYIVEIDKSLNFDKSTSNEEIMNQVNKKLEKWIKQHPEQWFWVHRRWRHDGNKPSV
jgi:KDO2-lipid IV(A) lauroyltransferase